MQTNVQVLSGNRDATDMRAWMQMNDSGSEEREGGKRERGRCGKQRVYI